MSSPTTSEKAINAAAERLMNAATTGKTCAPVRQLIPADDVPTAYAVQKIVNEARVRRGAKVTGRKIGLTAKVVQQQIGLDEPDFGVLFDDAGYANGAFIPWSTMMAPKVEAEVAFILSKDLTEGELDAAQVRDSIAYAVPSLEIVDSRVATWDIRIADTVADNASFGAYVLGNERLTLAEFEPKSTAMRMTVDGKEVSTGKGEDCLDDPINAVVWLARTARNFGDPLRAGHIILSGALGPFASLHPGAKVHAEFSGLGTVDVEFSN